MAERMSALGSTLPTMATVRAGSKGALVVVDVQVGNVDGATPHRTSSRTSTR